MGDTKNIAGVDFESVEWKGLVDKDPSLKLMASAWQDPSGVATTKLGTELFSLSGMGSPEEIPSEENRAELQVNTWSTYRTFGPVRGTIESKADYVAGFGFGVRSDENAIDAVLDDLYTSRRNKLYRAIPSWIIRMQAHGELFLLVSLDEKANATLRVIEPGSISGGNKGYGVISHPDDITTKLFYIRSVNGKQELIPDINLLFDPDLQKVASKGSAKIAALAKSSARAFRSFGGLRQFIIHWPNLTGETKFIRDSSALISILESKNLYWNTIKWQVDHKKAQTAYTVEISFEDSPAGRVAWNVWKKMSNKERDATGLTKTLTPGSRVFTMPGMKLKIHAPQLTKLQGENQDLLNIMGAGIRSPQDLLQGHSQGSTHASLRMSRPPLQIEVKNIQLRLRLFLDEVHEACLYAKSTMGLLKSAYSVEIIKNIKNGDTTYTTKKVKPHRLVLFSFPNIVLDDQPDNTANAWMGSAHTGVSALGVSDERVANALGVHNFDEEKRKKLLEERKYGKREPLILNPQQAVTETINEPKNKQ